MENLKQLKYVNALWVRQNSDLSRKQTHMLVNHFERCLLLNLFNFLTPSFRFSAIIQYLVIPVAHSRNQIMHLSPFIEHLSFGIGNTRGKYPNTSIDKQLECNSFGMHCPMHMHVAGHLIMGCICKYVWSLHDIQYLYSVLRRVPLKMEPAFVSLNDRKCVTLWVFIDLQSKVKQAFRCWGFCLQTHIVLYQLQIFD